MDANFCLANIIEHFIASFMLFKKKKKTKRQTKKNLVLETQPQFSVFLHPHHPLQLYGEHPVF